MIEVLALVLASTLLQVRDLGQYAQVDPTIRQWFDGLASKNGRCCSDADGHVVNDPDWGYQDKVGFPYWVVVGTERIDVPAEAVVTENNKVGYAIVWPVARTGGNWVRCFMPGTSG